MASWEGGWRRLTASREAGLRAADGELRSGAGGRGALGDARGLGSGTLGTSACQGLGGGGGVRRKEDKGLGEGKVALKFSIYTSNLWGLHVSYRVTGFWVRI